MSSKLSLYPILDDNCPATFTWSLEEHNGTVFVSKSIDGIAIQSKIICMILISGVAYNYRYSNWSFLFTAPIVPVISATPMSCI